MRSRRISWGAAVAFVIIVLAGCGGGGKPTGTLGTPTGKEGLDDLGNLLKEFEAQKKPIPRKVAEVEPVEPLHQAAYLSLVRGDVVYAWGVPLSPSGGDVVLAYEKKAETEGGWVLMQDGTVKQMTADAFRSAKKAGK